VEIGCLWKGLATLYFILAEVRQTIGGTFPPWDMRAKNDIFPRGEERAYIAFVAMYMSVRLDYKTRKYMSEQS